MLPPHGSSTQRHQCCPHTSPLLRADAQTARPWLLRADSVKSGVMPRMSNFVLIAGSATLPLPLVWLQGWVGCCHRSLSAFLISPLKPTQGQPPFWPWDVIFLDRSSLIDSPRCCEWDQFQQTPLKRKPKSYSNFRFAPE